MIRASDRSAALAAAVAQAGSALKAGEKAAWMREETAGSVAALHAATAQIQASVTEPWHRDKRAVLLGSITEVVNTMALLKSAQARQDAHPPVTIMIAQTKNHAGVLLELLNRSPPIASTPL